MSTFQLPLPRPRQAWVYYDGYEYLVGEEAQADAQAKAHPDPDPVMTRVTVKNKQLRHFMESPCAFCLEVMTKKKCVTTNCGHSYCKKCYQAYQRKSSCPTCRQLVDTLYHYSTKTYCVVT
jgi:hypothetical protein